MWGARLSLISAIGAGALAIALLGLCGYAWLRFTGTRDQDSISRLAASIGGGVSLIACCWLSSAAHPLLLWLALSLVLLASCGVLARDLLRGSRKEKVRAAALTLAATLALLAWRMYQVRHLAFPPWVDSVHHAVIVRKMTETWQLPKDLSPYLEMPFFYHFAFHGITSLFAAVTHLPLPQSMIVMGQVLQVGAGLSVYYLARVFWPQRLWAVVATVLACLVSQMPAYYTAWGKYPLLTAMVLLPLAMGVTVAMIRGGGSARKLVALAVLVAGTILAHSFAAFLLILFIGIALADAVVHWVGHAGGQHTTQDLRPGWLYVVGGAVLGVAMVSPWIERVWEHAGRFLHVQVGTQVLDPATTYFPGYLSYLWELSGPTRNRLFFTLALTGIGLAIRRPSLRPVSLWLVALLLLTNPWGLRLSPFSPDRVLIVLFLPACILATEALQAIARRLGRWHVLAMQPRRARQCVAAIVAAWAIWGGLQTRELVPQSAVLATESDAKAMAWVQTHTSPDARFFIRLAPWPPHGYRGMDGGWWLLPITGRHTLLPPALYGLGNSEQVRRTNQMAEGASSIAGCGPQFWDLVTREGLTHVYFSTDRSGLQPRSFDSCPCVERVYAHEGIYVYRLSWPPPH